MVLRSVRCLASASLVALLAAPGPSEVTILGKPGVFITIQAAIDAASDGGVLLIETGHYPPFVIDGKGLSLVRVQAVQQDLTVDGSCTIANLPEGRTVLLLGLRILGDENAPITTPALEVRESKGQVRLQGCFLRAGDDGYTSGPPFAGAGILAVDSTKVLLTQCELDGGDAQFTWSEPPKPGGDALWSINCAVALFDCTLDGGSGSDASDPEGGKGGAGFRVDGYGIFASGCTITGGPGGGGDFIGCTFSGDGGDGLVLSGAHAELLDSTITGGPAGTYGPCGLGSPGDAIVNNGGSLSFQAGESRKLTGPVQTPDKSSPQFTLAGVPGDQVWLIRANRPGFQLFPLFHGLAAVPFPWKLTLAPLGTIGAGGTLIFNLPIGDLTGPQAGWIWFLQGLCVQPNAELYLTSPLQLLIYNT